MVIYKEHTVVIGQTVNFSFPSYFVQGANPNPPSWFTWQTASPFGFEILTGYTFTAPVALGTYEIYFTELLSPPETYKIVINVVINDYEDYSNCCFNQSNIVWLNREGGWQNYIFTGIKTFEVEIGDSNTFVTEQLVKKFNEIKGVYEGKIVTTGDVPKSHIDILDSLKYSIQAFEYNPDSQAWDIPILIDKKSFTKYGSRDKFFETRLRFIYATEKLVQTQ